MSLATVATGFLSIKPKVRVEGDQLYARTHLLPQLLVAFAFGKTLRVDAKRRKIMISSRYFWFFTKRQVIPFERVAYVESDYKAWGSAWSYDYQATDEIESFITYLVLKDPEDEIELFRFTGDGAVQTGWGGVLLHGDSMVDFQGDQDKAYMQFIAYLGEMIGVPHGKPLEHLANEAGQKFVCSECGRNAPPNPNKPKCLYCGGTVVEDTRGETN